MTRRVTRAKFVEGKCEIDSQWSAVLCGHIDTCFMVSNVVHRSVPGFRVLCANTWNGFDFTFDTHLLTIRQMPKLMFTFYTDHNCWTSNQQTSLIVKRQDYSKPIIFVLIDLPDTNKEGNHLEGHFQVKLRVLYSRGYCRETWWTNPMKKLHPLRVFLQRQMWNISQWIRARTKQFM